ncbi:MAG: hypothetical protein ACT4PN_16235 [Nitrospiraceae bacterium]|jgi:hypothetical protein
MASKKKAPIHAFNFRGVPEKLFYRIKQAAAVEHLSARDWLLGLAEARLAELERQGKLPKDT